METDYRGVKVKYKLVSRLLSVKPQESLPYNRLLQLIDVEFMEFASSEASLAEAELAMRNLLGISDRINRMLSFPGIYQKSIVSIGGAFSAGKTEFINRIIKDKKLKLPIDIVPVTAIPTYIMHGEKTEIRALSSGKGTISITQSVFSTLTHDYLKALAFNLKDIMPTIAVTTPLEYKHTCFIDTPGYDSAPTAGGYTDTDISTAKAYIEKSNILLWVFNIGVLRTLQTQDLKFLRKLSLETRKLYFVASKADLLGRVDREKLLDQVTDLLKAEGIKYAGISAFDSFNPGVGELSFRKKSIKTFLRQQDRKNNRYKEIGNDLNGIFDKYKKAIENDIAKTEKLHKELHSLNISLLEKNYYLYTDKHSRNMIDVNSIVKEFETEELKKQLKKLESVRELMQEEIKNIIKELKGANRSK